MAHTETRRMDTYRKTLLDYSEEEVMGEAYFHALAEHFDGKGERDKLRLLARVERRAAEVVQPLLRIHDLMARDEVAAIEFAGREVAGDADSAAPLRQYLEQCMVWLDSRSIDGCGDGELHAHTVKEGST